MIAKRHIQRSPGSGDGGVGDALGDALGKASGVAGAVAQTVGETAGKLAGGPVGAVTGVVADGIEKATQGIGDLVGGLAGGDAADAIGGQIPGGEEAEHALGNMLSQLGSMMAPPPRPTSVRLNPSSRMHIAQLAQQYGYHDWKVLWALNSDLSSKRKNPFSLFHGDASPAQGDLVKLPPIKPKTEPAMTEVMNNFQLLREKVYLRLRILDENYQPLVKARYDLWLGTQKIEKPKDQWDPGSTQPPPQYTDSNGVIEHEMTNLTWYGKVIVYYKITVDGKDAEVPIKYGLTIGRLDPVVDPAAPNDQCAAGVQARLNNLGFDCGAVDGVLGNHTKGAIRRYRHQCTLADGDQSDQPLQTSLQKNHDTLAPMPAPPTTATVIPPPPPPPKK